MFAFDKHECIGKLHKWFHQHCFTKQRMTDTQYPQEQPCFMDTVKFGHLYRYSRY
jgi:hypothetical protein